MVFNKNHKNTLSAPINFVSFSLREKGLIIYSNSILFSLSTNVILGGSQCNNLLILALILSPNEKQL